MNKHLLSEERVRNVLEDCFYTPEELPDPDKPPQGAVCVEGIVTKFGFHPERLARHKDEIAEMLAELPDDGKFLYAVNDRHGNKWGSYSILEALICLGIATGQAELHDTEGLPYYTIGETTPKWIESNMPMATCPFCGYQCVSAPPIEGNAVPQPGSYVVCLSCASLFVFADDLSLRPMGKQEYDALDQEQADQLRQIQRTVRNLDRTKLGGKECTNK